jgi:hypothetical protein
MTTWDAQDRHGNTRPLPGRDDLVVCPSCERECPPEFMSYHHLRTKKVARLEQVQLCRDCHGFIHALFTNKQLADRRRELDTLEGLMKRPEYAKAVSFIRTVPPGRKVAIRESKRRKRRRRGRGPGFTDPISG